MTISSNEHFFLQTTFTDIQYGEEKGVDFIQHTADNPIFLNYQKTILKQINDEKRHAKIFTGLLSDNNLLLEASSEMKNFCLASMDITKTSMATVAVNTILENMVVAEFSSYQIFWKDELSIVSALESVLNDERRHSLFGLEWLKLHGSKKNLGSFEKDLIEWIEAFSFLFTENKTDQLLSKKREKELAEIMEPKYLHALSKISFSLEGAGLIKSPKMLKSFF